MKLNNSPFVTEIEDYFSWSEKSRIIKFITVIIMELCDESLKAQLMRKIQN